MADSEYWRLKTKARIEKREQQAACWHEVLQLDIPSQRMECTECGKRLTELEYEKWKEGCAL